MDGGRYYYYGHTAHVECRANVKKTDCLTDQKRAKVIILNPIISFLIKPVIGGNKLNMYVPTCYTPFWIILKQKLVMYSGSKSRGRVRFGSGSGSVFRVRVGFGDQHFGDVPLRFSGFRFFCKGKLRIG